MLAVVGTEDVLDEDGLLVVGQVRQELTEGLGGVQLAHWLHYSHHVNLRCVSFVGEVSKKSKHGTGPKTQGLKFNSTILQYLLSWNFTGLIFSCHQDILP